MHIISIPTIWSCKTPHCGWLNLAQVRQLRVCNKTQSVTVCVTWSNGFKQVFTGEDAKAIISSWQEASNKYTHQSEEVNNASN
ncbi:hypothetical protein [Cylindrospermum sp. FACHB-282]|uniref:hypothetical protein n=1 Tax=Cylindrospermum sp. FACHB-282 TaxID=2692794 RepID=UPI0016861CA7|nr:hypothetical protein [Cylindrospermum sp. FACHB-282]MBD2386928.1 hypothetical protein [Cylindrospermum sp. FACHB-282]